MSYKQVSCDFYDVLEAFATRKELCVITFNALKGQSTVTDIITDIFTKDNSEFLQLASGSVIRLDQLLEVNGIKPELFC